MFWVFGQEASRSVAPRSGIKPNPLHWKVETAKQAPKVGSVYGLSSDQPKTLSCCVSSAHPLGLSSLWGEMEGSPPPPRPTPPRPHTPARFPGSLRRCEITGRGKVSLEESGEDLRGPRLASTPSSCQMGESLGSVGSGELSSL